MELKEKLRQILRERYGIENDAEIIKEARALQGIDLGIFVNPYEKDEVKVVARMDKLPMWRYDLQGAIYQKGVEIVTGEKLPFYLAVVTKERVMDRDIWQIPQSTLDMALRQVEENIGRYADIKAGLLEPVHCGRCDYCKSIKQAAVRNYNELLEA